MSSSSQPVKRNRDDDALPTLKTTATSSNAIELHASMVLASTKSFVVVAHPNKVSFVHFVVVPKHCPADVGGVRKYLEGVKAFLDDFTPKCRNARSGGPAEKLLRQFAGAGPKWEGEAEIARWMSVYATVSSIELRVGMLALQPELPAMQIHVVSSDLFYVGNDAAKWNLYTAPEDKYFLSPDPARAELLLKAATGPLPTLGQITSVLMMMPLKCRHCGSSAVSVSALRRHSITTHNAQLEATLNQQQQEAEQQQSVADKAPAPTPPPLPQRPSKATCKDDVNSVHSLLTKWSEYYFTLLLRKQTWPPTVPQPRGLDDDAAAAGKVVEDLLAKPFLSQQQRQQLVYTQRTVRDRIFAPVLDSQQSKDAAAVNVKK
eukprot:PhM_4_TR18200/c0_g1_i1/m.71635